MPRTASQRGAGAAPVRRTVNLASAYALVFEECRIQDPDEKPNIEKMNRILIREASEIRQQARAAARESKHAKPFEHTDAESESSGRHIVNISRESWRLIEAECKVEEPNEKPNISKMNRRLVREAVAARKALRTENPRKSP